MEGLPDNFDSNSTLYTCSSLLVRTLMLYCFAAISFFSKITPYLPFWTRPNGNKEKPSCVANLSIGISGLGYAGWYRKKRIQSLKVWQENVLLPPSFTIYNLYVYHKKLLFLSVELKNLAFPIASDPIANSPPTDMVETYSIKTGGIPRSKDTH